MSDTDVDDAALVPAQGRLSRSSTISRTLGRRHWGNFDVPDEPRVPRGASGSSSTPTHPIFHSFFEIDDITSIPTAYNLGSGPQSSAALFEDNDPKKRMYAIANYRTTSPSSGNSRKRAVHPMDETNEAYKFGVNEFIYGITH